ncbi:MAG: hypothetical protein EZS28_040302, partial [Streblomastix strix]
KNMFRIEKSVIFQHTESNKQRGSSPSLEEVTTFVPPVHGSPAQKKQKKNQKDGERLKMDQPLFCYFQERKEVMKKDYRLFNSKHILPIESFHNGRHYNLKTNSSTEKLDDQN